MKSYVHVEYTGRTTEDIGCLTVVSAFEKQRKLLQNKNFYGKG